MKTDRSRFQEAHFSTGVFKNPEATNEDVFNIFEKEIQELLQNFKNNESNWRVQRVISHDIHHVESQLFGESSYVWHCWDRKEERQEWRWRILSMVHSQTPQPLSVKPSENLTWKMRWISWISLGLNFQYPWLFWWCDFPTEIKFRWTWEHCEPPPHLQQWREEALMSYQTHDQTSFISNFRSKWSSSLLHEMSEFLRKSWGKVRTHRNLPRTWASHGPQAWWWKREIKKHELQDASSICLLCWFRIFHRGDWNLRKKTRKEFYKWIWETRAFRTSPLLCKRESEKEVWYEANRETQKDWRLRSGKIIRHSSWERCKKYLPYPSGLSRQVKIPRISRTPKHVTCEKEFFDEDDENPIIRDHCHFSGRFRGAAVWNSRSQRRFLLSFTTSPKNQIERES